MNVRQKMVGYIGEDNMGLSRRRFKGKELWNKQITVDLSRQVDKIMN